MTWICRWANCGFERRNGGRAARLDDVLAALGTLDVPRLRVGIGRPARGDLSAYVLSPVADSEARGSRRDGAARDGDRGIVDDARNTCRDE